MYAIHRFSVSVVLVVTFVLFRWFRLDVSGFSIHAYYYTYIPRPYYYTQGRRNEKRARGANFVEGHRQNFNYVEIHTRKFRGSVAFFLRQNLTHHILSIASAITLDINTSQISSIYSATAAFIITN